MILKDIHVSKPKTKDTTCEHNFCDSCFLFLFLIIWIGWNNMNVYVFLMAGLLKISQNFNQIKKVLNIIEINKHEK